jgi:hypothetical protein
MIPYILGSTRGSGITVVVMLPMAEQENPQFQGRKQEV